MRHSTILATIALAGLLLGCEDRESDEGGGVQPDASDAGSQVRDTTERDTGDAGGTSDTGATADTGTTTDTGTAQDVPQGDAIDWGCDTTSELDSASPIQVTLADLHSASPPDNDCWVALSDLTVLVTIADIPNEGPAVFAQAADDGDPGTLELGIWIGARTYTELNGVGDVSELEPGDQIDVVAQFKSGRYGGNVLELRVHQLTRTGSGAPFTINEVADPGTLAPDASTSDDYEGLLVRMSDFRVRPALVDEFDGVFLPVDLGTDGPPALVLDATAVSTVQRDEGGNILAVGVTAGLVTGGPISQVTGVLWYRRTGVIEHPSSDGGVYDLERILVLSEEDIAVEE